MKVYDPAPEGKRLERQSGAVHNPFAINYIIRDIVEAWIGYLGEEYIGICYTILQLSGRLNLFQNRNLKQNALEWLKSTCQMMMLILNLQLSIQKVGKLQELHENASNDHSFFQKWGRLKTKHRKLLQKSTCENSHICDPLLEKQ